MVNPVSNKTVTLDQILAVEFLQQQFRRKVAQRYFNFPGPGGVNMLMYRHDCFF